ncbi:unnamed protein product [Aureobasidium pullulans]|nr:unnamed protein product [Aureobasidium pullulans]
MGYSSTLAAIALSIGSTYAWGWGGGDDSGGSSSSGSSGYGSGSSGSSSSGFGGSAGFSIPFGGDFERPSALKSHMPFLGYIHHRLFKKYKRRTFWSYAHLWLGRIIITLGMINGGLGLQLANNTLKGEIAYGVVAGSVWVVYIISIFVGESKRRRDRKAAVRAEAEPKRNESDSSDSRIRTNYYA